MTADDGADSIAMFAAHLANDMEDSRVILGRRVIGNRQQPARLADAPALARSERWRLPGGQVDAVPNDPRLGQVVSGTKRAFLVELRQADVIDAAQMFREVRIVTIPHGLA